MDSTRSTEINMVGAGVGAAVGAWAGKQFKGTGGAVLGAIAAALIGHLIEAELKKR